MRSFFFAMRRRAVLSALAGTGLFLLPGCAPPPPLIVGLHPFPPYHLLQWASQRADSAIRWNVVATATQQRQRLRFQQTQAGLLTLDEALRERALGTPLVVIGLIDQSLGTDQLLVRPVRDDPAVFLRTARVALEPTGVSALTYLAALRHFGLPLDWSRIVPLTPAEQLDAWQSGQIDAVVTFDPFAQKLRAAGAVPLFDSRQMPPLILDVIVAHEQALSSHEAGLRALMTSWVAAEAAWRRHPEATAQQIAPLAQLTPDEVMAAMAGIRLFDCEANRSWLRQGFGNVGREIAELLTVAGLGSLSGDVTVPATDHFLPRCALESP
jgi:NitT/TauT family transport system substrate-binding protein